MHSSVHTELSSAGESRPNFEMLIKQHYSSAYRYAFGLTGNRDDAEDLTQDTFIRAYRAFASYDSSRPFRAWLQRIIYTQFIDQVRKKRSRPTIPLEACMKDSEDGEMFALEIPDERSDPERLFLDGTLDERLERALNLLPIEFRTAILLCDKYEMSYDEIAQAMRCTLGTVRSRLHRGRKMLRQTLDRITADPTSSRMAYPAFVA